MDPGGVTIGTVHGVHPVKVRTRIMDPGGVTIGTVHGFHDVDHPSPILRIKRAEVFVESSLNANNVRVPRLVEHLQCLDGPVPAVAASHENLLLLVLEFLLNLGHEVRILLPLFEHAVSNLRVELLRRIDEGDIDAAHNTLLLSFGLAANIEPNVP